jgi:hypothetical protein
MRALMRYIKQQQLQIKIKLTQNQTDLVPNGWQLRLYVFCFKKHITAVDRPRLDESL